ncbi:MAG: hypothetical protein ACYDA6_00200 [Solirubrobacteraceae bacterium]
MMAGASGGSDDDWRLEAELGGHQAGAVKEIVARFRHDGAAGVEAEGVSEHVLVTHNGGKLFAYAATEEEVMAARVAIEGVLRRDGVNASLTVSTWESGTDRWRQVDPPLAGEAALEEDGAERDATALQTRTLVASIGRLIGKEVEETMLAAAQELGITCQVVKHPHLLTTQVAFTVSGPRHKVDQFATDLRAECHATLRTDGAVFAAATL